MAARPIRTSDPDWTTGPAKWAAVLVLGGASVFGMTWSIVGRRPRPTAVSTAPARAMVQEEPVNPSPPPNEPDGRAGAVDDAEAPRALAEPVPPPVAPLAAAANAGRSRASAPASLARKVNVNTAPAAELELLPGIGPALAARIIADRAANGPFKTVEELDRVKGIGPRTIEKFRSMATVQ